MTADLIVDFPRHHRIRRAVYFAETAQVQTFERPNVDRRELFYTQAEYDLMALARRQDVLKVRVAMASRDGEEDDEDKTVTKAEESVCVMGIEHLLTPVCIKAVRTCRARCIGAVLTAQARARQGPCRGFGWEAIALASLAQTRNATLRATKLGKFHHESI